jgi:hypothetical protein
MTFLKHYTKVCCAALAAYAALLMVVVACDDDALVCVPDQPCYALAGGQTLFDSEDPCGLCALGTFDCATDTCVGSIQPAPEVCDGEDNDCDCEVDEDLALDVGEPGNDCPVGNGACADAIQVCENGVERCLGKPTPEECDGIDNDCNGNVDDVLAVFSYSGPPATLAFPPCRPRAEVCIGGAPRVTEEVLPMETDLCGNEVDDDCDGLVDEPDDPAGARSVVLVVDASGSMEDDQQRLADGFCAFANGAVVETFVKVVSVASADDYPWVEVVGDWAPATDACALLSAGFVSGQAYEHMLDGVMLGIGGWPSGDRAIVVLTDERMQVGVASANEVRVACAAEAFELFVFTTSNYFTEWDYTVAECGGQIARLDSGEMAPLLSQWLEPQCL